MDMPRQAKWDERFETGEPQVDFQHQAVFTLFNQMADAIANSDHEEVNTVLESLKAYSHWHFRREEDCMEQYRCPMADANKATHEAFLCMLREQQEDWKNHGGTIEHAAQIHAEILNWFEAHISNIDLSLRECVKQGRA